jgi:predicted dehydrogenase
MLNLFIGSAPKTISAAALTQGDQKLHESCDFSVQIHYENGSIGTLLYTDLGHPKFPRERLEVFSGGALLRLEDYGRAEVLSGKGWREKGSVNMGHGQELSNFIGAILGREKPMGEVEDGLRATLVAQAAWKSMQTGGAVRIQDLTLDTDGEVERAGTLRDEGSSSETGVIGLLAEILGSESWDDTGSDE